MFESQEGKIWKDKKIEDANERRYMRNKGSIRKLKGTSSSEIGGKEEKNM